MALSNIKAPKNGYAYVYISNQSNNDVYFDDFQVGVTAGNIIEENHYYAYGLKISTISSRKLGNSNEGNLKNNYLYQGAFNEFDDDIGWNDFDLRNYDPQTGRWVQQDVYDMPFYSPYTGMGNDPINNVDPTGGIYIPPIAAPTGKILDEVVVYAVRSTAKVATSTMSVLNKIASISAKVSQISQIINTSFQSFQVGDRAAIYSRGFRDATLNALGWGWHDAWHGTALSDYKDPYDQYEYLQGRIAGDKVILGASLVLMDQGISGGLSGALVSGGSSVLAGAGAIVYGGFAIIAAIKDMQWATKKLADIQSLIKANTVVSCGPEGAKNPDGSKWEKPQSDSGGGLKYSPTKKHQKGGWGTEMDLDDATATKVLNNSFQDGKQRYSYHKGKLYEFQPDNVGGWHGYPIKGNEAPVSVFKQMKAKGTITSAEYNKLIKGK